MFLGFALKDKAERRRLWAEAKATARKGDYENGIHPLEGVLLLFELGLYFKLEPNVDLAHTHLNQFIHSSLRISDVAKTLRGRGRFTSTILYGNGLGRLLKARDAWEFWEARENSNKK